jgi:two-component system, OmpR family, sensor histidine kinase ArlS
MKIPSFMRTIRFRLTLWYVSFLMIVIVALLVGLNAKVGGTIAVPTPDGSTQQVQTLPKNPDNNIRNELLKYSITGAAIALVVGSIGIYFISGAMLRPIDKVTSLAKRSSYSNLKERLNYKGPNDEVRRLADTFDDMLNRLKGAVESQKQFVQDASHELRTPIATAMTNIEVLEMNSTATIPDYQELTRVLKLSLDRMNNISTSLQLLSEENTLTAKLEKVNIPKIIDEIADEAALEARRQGVVIEWKPPDVGTFILGDPFRIKQALFNLVDNAVRYNHPGGSVNITLSTENQLGIIQVTDTGIGIAKDNLSRIFDRFFRVDKSRSRQRGGSGLGLAIVKKVVEEHNGTVCVDSIPGKGTTFRVELPLFPN